MKSFAPAIPMILVLSVCVGFLIFKTFQLQAQINILVDLVQESPKAVEEPMTVEPAAAVIEAVVIPKPTVEELVKEVEVVNEEEAEELRCQLRAQNTSCKGSVKEMKAKKGSKAAAAH